VAMKRFTYAMVMAVALVVLVSSFAIAGGPACKSAAKQASLEECCIKAAKAGEGCHGKDAEAVKAAYASYKESCADKAACKTASAAKAACEAACKTASADKAAYHKAAAEVKADMHKCCATALDAGKGCCGQEADAMKADYDKKVEAEAKKVAATDKGSDDS
ncbi:MAG: hypothetical protein ABFS30_14150, partial [Pseudomonadota bacterium]